MKRQVSFTLLATFIGVVSSLLVFMSAQAQIDAFTYFVPFSADELRALFDVNTNIDFSGESVNTTISISVLQDNTTIYYDHWEDGLEDILTQPVQPTTEVWGDGDPTNGIPPGFPGDVLQAGDVVVLQNAIPPNNTAVVYDGGDKLTAVGGSLAVSLANWPTPFANTLYAGAWGLLPTSDWGTQYAIGVGQNLAGQRAGFTVVAVNVQAALDNTVVELDLDADGVFEQTRTLSEGQQFIERVSVAGARIRTVGDNPVQVQIFTIDPAQNYEARAYTIIPDKFLSNEYLAPRSSDGDFWIYNPNPNPLVVNVTTVTQTVAVTIPANSTGRYPPVPSPLSLATGTRFTSTLNFSVLAAFDSDFAQDWGHTVLPTGYLSTQVLVGWAPGNNTIGGPTPSCGNPPPPGDESRVYVTAETTTTINVDYDLDGTIDATFPITPLAEVGIVDPNDCDMTGAFLFTDGTSFAAVWGQDENAPVAQPSIDVGTGTAPLNNQSVQKTIELLVDADNSGTITWGDTVRFQIFVANNTVRPFAPVSIIDQLPSSVTYNLNTSTLRGAPIPDDTVPPNLTEFPFDETGFQIPGGLQPLEVVTATFDALVNEDVDTIENTVNLIPPTDPGVVEVPVLTPRLELSKRLVDPPSGIANRGEAVTFVKTITSTGNISVTKLPFFDTYDPNDLTYRSANPAPDSVIPGLITWNDLATTTVFGPLPRGRAISVTLTFTANANIPPDVTNTVNTAIISGAEGIDGSSLPPLTDTAEVAFVPPATPTPTPTPTSPPSRPDDDDDDGPSAPTPTPQPPPAVAAAPAPSPTPSAELPVAYLPETGTRGTPTGWLGISVLLLLAIGIGATWVTRSGRR